MRPAFSLAAAPLLGRTLWGDSELEKLSVDYPFFFFFLRLTVFSESVFSPSHIGPVAHLCATFQPFLLSDTLTFPKGFLSYFFGGGGVNMKFTLVFVL